MQKYFQCELRNFKFLILAIFLLGVIIGVMGATVWGDLAKDATHSQLITEAIAEAIDAHNNDPTAHLGSGQSLEQHKTNDVIDHPASSIVPDKFSANRTFLFLPVIPYISGNVSNATASNASPFLSLNQVSPASGDGVYTVADLAPADLGWSGGDFIIDFLQEADIATGTGKAIFTFGCARITILKTDIKVGYYDGSWHDTTITPTNPAKPMRFRFFFDSTDGALYVFLNDVQVFTHSYTLQFEDDEFLAQFIINRGTSSNITSYLANVNVWFAGI